MGGASTKHQIKGTASKTDKDEGNKILNGIRNAIGLVVKSAVTFISVPSILGLIETTYGVEILNR